MSAGTRDSGKRIRCYTCGNFGHVAKASMMIDGSGWRRISLGKGLPTQNFVSISDPQMCAAYPIHIILLHLIMIIYGEEYK
jgi:hypothetical protein